ncbi:hypothetical protein WN55_05473 [Dufourea novaeangliae]|uniref:Uncharacterized protein n=1 Tax=Dufourea novaeangliae TaxID=178035 RepID=A0A154PP85_DUFNO|nr:hypothetical protein WN55_05473 [Dufourea novaeangliae]
MKNTSFCPCVVRGGDNSAMCHSLTQTWILGSEYTERLFARVFVFPSAWTSFTPLAIIDLLRV